MEKLDQNLLIKIFDYLNLTDLFNCRLVNKKFKDTVKHVKITELVFQDIDFYIKNNYQKEFKWFYFNIPLNNIFKLEDFDDILFNLIKSTFFNFNYLKRLKFDYSILDGNFEIDYLNRFIYLEQLEFSTKHVHGCNLTLKLPSLKILSLRRIDSGWLAFEVPKLEIFSSFNGFELIKFKEPAIKDDEILNVCELSTCNLMVIKNGTNYFPTIDQYEILKYLPNLKIIDFHSMTLPFYIHIKAIQQTINHIIKEKVNLNRTGIKILLNDKIVSS